MFCAVYVNRAIATRARISRGLVVGCTVPSSPLLTNPTLRGGQAVETEGSVIVFGNVNPGAQITAGGSVDIRGTCRGVVVSNPTPRKMTWRSGLAFATASASDVVDEHREEDDDAGDDELPFRGKYRHFLPVFFIVK